MSATIARCHPRRFHLCRLGRGQLFGAFVPVHLAHRSAGAAIPLRESRTSFLWVHREKQIFAQQMSRWCVPYCKTRSGATASPIRHVLVMLHTGVLHSFAARPVGGYQGWGATAQVLLLGRTTSDSIC